MTTSKGDGKIEVFALIKSYPLSANRILIVSGPELTLIYSLSIQDKIVPAKDTFLKCELIFGRATPAAYRLLLPAKGGRLSDD